MLKMGPDFTGNWKEFLLLITESKSCQQNAHGKWNETEGKELKPWQFSIF